MTSRHKEKNSTQKTTSLLLSSNKGIQNTPSHSKLVQKYPPQDPSSRKCTPAGIAKTDHNATPRVDFTLTSASPNISGNSKAFKTAQNKGAVLNLMEEARDSSIYDTITTYTGAMTTNKKDQSSICNYHSIDLKQKFSEAGNESQKLERSNTAEIKAVSENGDAKIEDPHLNNSLSLTQTSFLNENSNLELAKKKEEPQEMSLAN
jgi:hypothetical protein